MLSTDLATVPITTGKAEKERAGPVKLIADATALLDTGKTADELVKLTTCKRRSTIWPRRIASVSTRQPC